MEPQHATGPDEVTPETKDNNHKTIQQRILFFDRLLPPPHPKPNPHIYMSYHSQYAVNILHLANHEASSFAHTRTKASMDTCAKQFLLMHNASSR